MQHVSLQMQLEGQSAEEDMTTDAVYTGDLQVNGQFQEEEEEEEANVEAGSPASSQQRRRMRAQTMRLSGRTAPFPPGPVHARGYSDTTAASTTGRTGPSFTTTGFTSVNAPRPRPQPLLVNGLEWHREIYEDVEDDDRMRID
ncbi:hypothetical protein GQX73_g1397 [Xylaria multiplex]|uniref:Uncharacterized protein n=1 Tax=Xylaria multiplex TaxID=323545 RepID=A0A7C8J289_9PEZI|nr:hypothetical protein GQX73_g1397 [Xylaria multiplex]